MNNMKRTELLCLLFAFWILPLQAYPNFTFKKYQVEDGLSHNTVWCALQDSYGFVWLGTNDGLNCYDGLTSRIYRNVLNDSTSLGNNFVQSLFEDENHDLWVGTNSGLYIYHRQTDSFSYFDRRTPYGVFISSEVKRIIKSTDGLVWIATLGQGLFVYDPVQDTLQQNSLQSSFMWDVCESPTRIYSSSLQEGLLCFDKDGHYLRSFPLMAAGSNPDNYRIHCLLTVAGDVWFGAGSNLLYRLDEATGQLDCYNAAAYNFGAIHSLLSYSDTQLLLGTDNGLYLFDATRKAFARLDNPSDPRSLSDQTINAMMRDAEGGLWILTNLGGVNYQAKQTKQFDYYPPVYHEGLVYAGKVIGPFCEGRDGNLWVGTRSGLCHFDVRTQQLNRYAISGRTDLNFDIRSLLLDGDRLWIGTYGEGLRVLDIPTGRLKSYRHLKDIPNTICSDDVLALHKDRSGQIFVGTSWGLCRYNAAEDNFSTITTIGSMISVVDILEDVYENLWIATASSGVFRYSRRNDHWKHYLHQSSDPATLTNNSIIKLFEDSKGTMWFGTNGGGLCSFHAETETFVDFDPTSTLLPNRVIYSIEEDRTGDFWISGNTGLVTINPVTKQHFRRFTVDDGLQGNQFTAQSSLRASGGRLYFGGINGFNSFLPERFTDNQYIPPVYITDIRLPYLSNKQAARAKLHLEGPLYLARTITLPYECNSFSLQFVALSYEDPLKNRYSYRLRGVDKDWVVSPTPNIASYTNLPPGKYEFEVRGSNNDHLWNEKNASLLIVITPPWWLSVWAYCLYALCLLGVAVYIAWRWNAFVRMKYKRRMKEYQVLKEEEVYKSKISFFVNLVHEIRTPLSLIRLPLEKLLDERKDERDARYLHVIDRNVNYLLGITNQLLDFQKMENGGIRLNLKRCNVSELLKVVYEQFAGPAELGSLSLTLDVPRQEVYAQIDSENVCKIIVNLVSNAVKYARTRIDIRLVAAESTFSIFVDDDGPGITDAEKQRIFEAFYQVDDTAARAKGTGIGLAFSKSLAEVHHGTLTVVDSNYGGSSFILTLPVGEKTPEPAPLPEIVEDVATETGATDAAEHPARKFTVLLVEDNIELLNLTRESLSTWFKVLKAHNGRQALEVLATEVVDVIVSDVMMPEMDGMELTERVKSDIDYSHIPVILLTAKTTLEAKVEGFDCGADAFVEKPFSIHQLRKQIENLLKLRQAFHKMMTALSGSTPQALATEFTLSQRDCDFIAKVQQAIGEQLSNENFSVDTLAEALNMSRSNFYRKIKALSGMAPNDYLKTIRLNKAAELLKSGMRIIEVCEQVGFNSSSYFAKCFKAQFGVLPKDFLQGEQ